MRSWALRQLFGMAVGIVAAVFILMPSAMAQNGPQPTVQQFLANPSQVLAQFPGGGARLISLIRDAAVFDPSALNAIIALLGNANPDQQMAIGSGLGQAALLEQRTNQAYATQIQDAIGASGVQNAILAFAGVTGNVQTAAGGGGGGGGGGGSFTGTQVCCGSNFGNSTLGSSTTQTTTQNYFTGGHAFGNATSTTSISRSVSAH